MPQPQRSIVTRVRIALDDLVLVPARIIIASKLALARALLKRRFKKRVMVCYPEKPKNFHMLYQIAHHLGYTISNNHTTPADCYVAFEDTTFRASEPGLATLVSEQEVINSQCDDISKRKVDAVFEEVFGYKMSLDPQKYKGVCVRKSDINAVHDGVVVVCPTVAEDGYIYQKLIDTQEDDDSVVDIRLYVFKNTIPFAFKRFKSIHDRFDITEEELFVETNEVLSEEEIGKTLLFCEKMGLTYGELDALRCNETGRIYIVDVNNTPSSPRRTNFRNRDRYEEWFSRTCKAFETAFLHAA